MHKNLTTLLLRVLNFYNINGRKRKGNSIFCIYDNHGRENSKLHFKKMKTFNKHVIFNFHND